MNNLYGIEINDQIARVCKMNMIIHDDGHTNVISTDSLKNVDEITKQHKGFKKNQFDILLTNPPFGAVIKSTEKDYLDKYELGKGKKNQKTEILFIERCLDFLKPNGKMAIVLPDSITINSSLQKVRDYIFEQTQILSIVSLPDIAFVHYGANVKSSLLFLRRLGSKETHREYPVFMALAERIGYTATGKKDDNDLPVIIKHYNKFLKQKTERLKIAAGYEDKIFTISSSELRGRRIDPKGYTKKFRKIKSMIKQNNLPKINLKDCITKSISGDWGLDPNIEKVPEGYELCYVLRNTNFDNNFNLDLSDVALRYIESKKIQYLQLKKNEILVEKSGGSPIQPVGRIAIIDDLPKDKPVIFSNFLQKLIVDTKKIDPLYLYCYLKTLYHRDYMGYIQNQTTGIKNLLLNEFYEIQVIKPDTKTQEKIGQQYYDDILKVKKRINEAYETLKSSKQKTDNRILK